MAIKYKPEAFGYSRGVFYIYLILYSIVLVLALTYSLLTPYASLFWTSAILIVLAFCIVLFGLSPLMTKHIVTGSKILLRQGWYFRSEIPMDNLAGIKKLESMPVKVGVKFVVREPTLYVTSERHNLVEIKLIEPQVFPMAWWKRADRIIINVENRNRFVELVEGRRVRVKVVGKGLVR